MKNKPLFVNIKVSNADLAQELDKTAKKLQISRASLFKMALAEFLDKRDKAERKEAIAA